jgi:hypothetical protein
VLPTGFEPPRCSNAFFHFRREFHHGNLISTTQKEISENAGEAWKALTVAEKKPFFEAAAAEMSRFEVLFPKHKYVPEERRRRNWKSEAKKLGISADYWTLEQDHLFKHHPNGALVYEHEMWELASASEPSAQDSVASLPVLDTFTSYSPTYSSTPPPLTPSPQVSFEQIPQHASSLQNWPYRSDSHSSLFDPVENEYFPNNHSKPSYEPSFSYSHPTRLEHWDYNDLLVRFLTIYAISL